MKRFLPVSIHVHGKDSRIYAKNKAGRKRYYKPEETKDLLKTGGSVFGLKDHFQRFKNFFSLLKIFEQAASAACVLRGPPLRPGGKEWFE